MNINDEQLKEISLLAIQQLHLERDIANLELQLEEAKNRLNNISQSRIPEAMMAVGMESFKLADGTMVKVEKFYSGKIPDDKQSEAFAWLRSTKNDSLIKREVKCNFGKGEDRAAAELMELLESRGYSATDKQSVHPMTLKSFIREQFESGSEFPAELFGAYVGNKTKIAPAKKAAAMPHHDEL